MSVQHEYRGVGDPNGVVTAPVNSHYLDEETWQPWLCVFNDGTECVWLAVGAVVPPVPEYGNKSINENPEEFVASAGGSVTYQGSAALLSNVDFTSGSYSTGGPCHVSVRTMADGRALCLVTPLAEYMLP